jgi:hypothetical protein
LFRFSATRRWRRRTTTYCTARRFHFSPSVELIQKKPRRNSFGFRHDMM